MQIQNITTGETGYHASLFPNVSFPPGGPDPGWLTENGCAEVVPEPYMPTTAEIESQTLAALTNAVQQHLDSKARERNYDGILSACSYVSSTNIQFAAEAQACVEWRDACWAGCYEVMTAVKLGTREIPTSEELVEALPVLEWP